MSTGTRLRRNSRSSRPRVGSMMSTFSGRMMVYLVVVAVLGCFLLIVSEQNVAVNSRFSDDASRHGGVLDHVKTMSHELGRRFDALETQLAQTQQQVNAAAANQPPPLQQQQSQRQGAAPDAASVGGAADSQRINPIHDVANHDLRLSRLAEYMVKMGPSVDQFMEDISSDPSTARDIELDFCAVGLYCIPGQSRVGRVTWDGVVLRFLPSLACNAPHFALMSTGVMDKNEFNDKVRVGIKERLVMKMLYAEVHGYEVAQYMLKLKDMVEYAVEKRWISRNEVGKYINDEELFGGHLWYNAWTKPYALLGEMLSSRFHWILFLDLDAQVDYDMIGTPLTKFVPEDRDAVQDVRNREVQSKKGFASGVSHARTAHTPDWYYKDSDFHVVAPAYASVVKNPRFQMTFSTYAFMVRSSHESELLMRAWLGHSDCNCWVEQSALWIELVRMAMRFNQPLTPAFEAEYDQCMEKLYGATGKANMKLESLTIKCRNPGELAKQRRCSESPETSSMACHCNKSKCLDSIWQQMQLDGNGDMRPPIGFWNRDSGTKSTANDELGLRNFILHEKGMTAQRIVSGDLPPAHAHAVKKYEKYRGVGIKDDDGI